MYLSFYNLKSEPFKISTDPSFLWLGEKHKEALAVLKYGILGNKGILLLTGDVGTGKTTLINMLLQDLGENVIVATIPDPGLEKMDFFNFVASAFNINKTFYTKGEFLLYFTHFLKNAHSDNKKVLLIIDEAQRLDQQMLEEIRLLSNIELQHTKLINLFFVGQPEFNDLISLDENRALRQRITLRYNINPLTLKETALYIKHRLHVAGTDKTLFNSNAITTLYSYTKGYPRLVNVICDYALLTGFVKEKKIIGPELIKECAEELKIPSQNIAQIPRKAPVETPVEIEPPKPAAEAKINEAPAKSVPSSSTTTSQNLPNDDPLKKEVVLSEKPASKNRMALPLFIILLMSIGYYLYAASDDRLKEPLKTLWQTIHSRIQGSNSDQGISNTIPIEDKNAVGDPLSVKIIAKTDNISNTSQNKPKTVAPADSGQANPDKDLLSLPREEDLSAVQSIPPTSSLNHQSEPEDSNAKKPNAEAEKLDKLPSHDSDTNPGEPNAPQSAQPLGIFDEKGLHNDRLNNNGQSNTKAIIDQFKPEKILIFFDSNSFSLTDEAIAKLDQLIKELVTKTYSGIIIKGYTDNTGPFVYNERLSIFRAFSVKSYLVDNGISPYSTKAYGMGPRPLVDESGKKIPPKMTRSVEIEIIPN